MPLRVVDAERFEEAREEPVAHVTVRGGEHPHGDVGAGVAVLEDSAAARAAEHRLREVGAGHGLVAEPGEVDAARHGEQVLDGDLVDARAEVEAGQQLGHAGAEMEDPLVHRDADGQRAHALGHRVQVLAVVAAPAVRGIVVADPHDRAVRAEPLAVDPLDEAGEGVGGGAHGSSVARGPAGARAFPGCRNHARVAARHTAGDCMRSATRITIGVLATELVVMAVLLLLADRWEDMGWPALGMEHPLIALGLLMPPLIVVTAVALVLLAATRILVAEVGALRARRAPVADGLSASSRPAPRR